MTILRWFFLVSRKASKDLIGNEVLFLKNFSVNGLNVLLLYEVQTGYLLDGTWINFDDDGNILYNLLREFIGKSHSLILEKGDLGNKKTIELKGFKVFNRSQESQEKISKRFKLGILEEFEFLEEKRKDELKLDFFILENILYNCYILESPRYEAFQEFCGEIIKELLGESGNPEIKEKNDHIKDHFPEKMHWCKKCIHCATNSKKIKKTKYKCPGCSEIIGKDAALCLNQCFQRFHLNKIDPLMEKKPQKKKRN
jgi:hypothetical protein